MVVIHIKQLHVCFFVPFQLNHPTTVIPRGSVFDRFVHHPRWGRFNRRLLDVCLVLILTTIPIVTLPLLISGKAPTQFYSISYLQF